MIAAGLWGLSVTVGMGAAVGVCAFGLMRLCAYAEARRDEGRSQNRD